MTFLLSSPLLRCNCSSSAFQHTILCINPVYLQSVSVSNGRHECRRRSCEKCAVCRLQERFLAFQSLTLLNRMALVLLLHDTSIRRGDTKHMQNTCWNYNCSLETVLYEQNNNQHGRRHANAGMTNELLRLRISSSCNATISWQSPSHVISIKVLGNTFN